MRWMVLAAAVLVGGVARADDPLKGSTRYHLKLGDRAVLHDYDDLEDAVRPTLRAWVSTTELARYCRNVDAFFADNPPRLGADLLAQPPGTRPTSTSCSRRRMRGRRRSASRT